MLLGHNSGILLLPPKQGPVLFFLGILKGFGGDSLVAQRESEESRFFLFFVQVGLVGE